MSIVDPDYRARYRGTGDWFKQLIDNNCYNFVLKKIEETQPDGTIKVVEVPTKRRVFDVEQMFDLALENGIAEERLEKFRKIVGTTASEGRIRMSVGNMLRSVARKQGYLIVKGTKHNTPEGFGQKVQNQQEAA